MIYLTKTTTRFRAKEPHYSLFQGKIELAVARSFIVAQGCFTPVFDKGFDTSEVFLNLRLGVGCKVTPLFVAPEEKIFLLPDDMIFIVSADTINDFKVLVVLDRRVYGEPASKEYH